MGCGGGRLGPRANSKMPSRSRALFKIHLCKQFYMDNTLATFSLFDMGFAQFFSFFMLRKKRW